MIEMKEQLEKLAATGKITEANLEALLTLAEAGFCSHRSWGVGKIVKLDPLRERIIIDFEGKPGHSMDITFAAETLRPIKSDHILARRITDLETLQNLAQEKPLELIKLLMESFLIESLMIKFNLRLFLPSLQKKIGKSGGALFVLK